MKTHPAAELFPMMCAGAFGALKADIEKNGLREPIWTHEGLILDGRNRYRACVELGVEIESREYTGNSPTAFVWSLNGTRRHMTTSQLGAVAAKMQPALQAEAAKRKAAAQLAGRDTDGKPVRSAPIGHHRESDEAPTGKSRDIAAKIVGVGATTVDRAQFVMKNDPAMFQRVESGEVTVTAAVEAIKNQAALESPRSKPRADRVAEIAALAAEGNRAAQIAEKAGISVFHVRNIANAEGIPLPDAKIGKVHGINVSDLVARTVHGVEAYSDGLQIIKNASLQIEADAAAEFAASLAKSIRELGWLKNQMREIAT